MDGAVRLQPAHRLDAHGAVAAYTAQVVAHQVDNHDVFRPILGAVQQFARTDRVFLWCRAAGPGALDRTRFDLTALHSQEPLRRGTGQGEITQIEVAGEGCRVALPQSPVQVQGWSHVREQQTLRDIDLEAVAGVNILDGTVDRGEIARTVEVAR